MKRTIIFVATILVVMSYSALAVAFDIDFQAKIMNNFDFAGVKKPKLVGVYTFNGLPNDLAITGKPFTVSYEVRKLLDFCIPIGNPSCPYEEIYSGTASIIDGQTQVVNGTAKTGKITLTYDADIGEIVGRFDLILNSIDPYYTIDLYYIKVSAIHWEGGGAYFNHYYGWAIVNSNMVM